VYKNIFNYYSNLCNLSCEDEALLKEKLQLKSFKKKEIVLRKNQVCKHVYFINKGIMRSFSLINGKEQTNQFYFENSYCSSYESFLIQSPSPLIIENLTDTEVWALAYKDVQKLYTISPALNTFGRKIAELLYIDFNMRSRSLQIDDAKTRYLNIIKNRPEIIQKIPNYLIASFIGVTPESLSRIKNEVYIDSKN